MQQKAQICGLGIYLPKNIVTNDDLAKRIDTTDEWIQSRSGIRQRHIAADDEVTSDIGFKAAQNALKNANMSIEDIDTIIVATTTPDRTTPATGAYIQRKFGVSHGAVFDVQGACSGFVYGLDVAAARIETGRSKNTLLVAAETLSRITNWQDRTTAVLFGDGGGAVVLCANSVAEAATQSHIIGSYLRLDGCLTDILETDGGASYNKQSGELVMRGREVFRHAVINIAESVTVLLEQTGYTASDIDWFVPHQANRRIIDGVGTKLNFPQEKTIITVDKHANTSAASIPLALHAGVEDGRIKRGDLVMVAAMGAGLSWGSALIRW